jgi:hypothetical protein
MNIRVGNTMENRLKEADETFRKRIIISTRYASRQLDLSKPSVIAYGYASLEEERGSWDMRERGAEGCMV